MDKKEGLRVLCRKIPRNRLISLGILVLLMVAATVMNPAFLTADNLLGILAQNSARGILALGATFCLNDGAALIWRRRMG